MSCLRSLPWQSNCQMLPRAAAAVLYRCLLFLIYVVARIYVRSVYCIITNKGDTTWRSRKIITLYLQLWLPSVDFHHRSGTNPTCHAEKMGAAFSSTMQCNNAKEISNQ